MTQKDTLNYHKLNYILNDYFCVIVKKQPSLKLSKMQIIVVKKLQNGADSGNSLGTIRLFIYETNKRKHT